MRDKSLPASPKLPHPAPRPAGRIESPAIFCPDRQSNAAPTRRTDRSVRLWRSAQARAPVDFGLSMELDDSDSCGRPEYRVYLTGRSVERQTTEFLSGRDFAAHETLALDLSSKPE